MLPSVSLGPWPLSPSALLPVRKLRECWLLGLTLLFTSIMSHSLLLRVLRGVTCSQDKKPGLWMGSWGLAGGEWGWEVKAAPGQPLVLLQRGLAILFMS